MAILLTTNLSNIALVLWFVHGLDWGVQGAARASVLAEWSGALLGLALAWCVERSDLPLLVDFWAPWCGPCKMMAPQFQQAARQLEPRVRLAKVNTEAEPHLAAQFGIRSIPTLALFQGGREIGRQAGALGAQDIVRWASAQVGR